MVRPLHQACVLVLTTLAIYPQNGRLTVVRGELRGTFPADSQVELQPCQGVSPASASLVSSTGSFEVRNVESGCYRVSVVSLSTGHKLHESLTEVGPATGSLELRMRETPAAQRPVTGVVNARQVRVPTPKKARKAFVDAAKASEAGDRERAVAKLQEAIRLHPDFAEAHSNLGTNLSRLGRHAEALAEFETARRLDDSSAIVWTNCAASYLEAQRIADAEHSLREAVRRDPGYAPAHYLLGSVAVRRRDLGEARRQLQIAAETMPAARLALERLNSVRVR